MAFDRKSAEAVLALRELLLAGDECRLRIADQLHLSFEQARTVVYLLASGPTAVSELARALGPLGDPVGDVVAELEARGIVERIPDHDDHRRLLIQIAESDHVLPAWAQGWMEAAFLEVPRASLSALTDGLRAIADGLHAVASELAVATGSRRP